jgi:hypothetical protein
VELELELLEFTLELELELIKKHQFHFLVFCKNLSITECEKLNQSDSVYAKSDHKAHIIITIGQQVTCMT